MTETASPRVLSPSKAPSPNSSEENATLSKNNLCKNLSKTFDQHIGAKRSRHSSEESNPLLSVYLRIRPNADNTIEALPCKTKIRTYPPEESNAGKRSGNLKEYVFEKVFEPTVSQEYVYDELASPLVKDVAENQKSGLLFAYGSSNAGKTHTIVGTDVNQGILPRAMEKFLTYGHDLELSYFEIYNEQIYDLLGSSSEKLKLGEDKSGKIFVKGLSNHSIKSIDHGLQLIKEATLKRHTSSNNINTVSSRSHSICQLKLMTSKKPYLYLVDLAGAERSKRTNSRSFRLREANIINSSLMKLNKCLGQMQQQQHPISFRESKLTHLFMNHFQGTDGRGNVVMVVNVNPSSSDYDETQSILGYASVAKSVQIPVAEYNKKRRLLVDNYISVSQKRKRDNLSIESNVAQKKQTKKVARPSKKLSPRATLKKQRELTEKRRRELEILRVGKVKTKTSTTIVTRSSHRKIGTQVDELKEHIKQIESEKLKLATEAQQLKEGMAHREIEIRKEVAEEMKHQIVSIKQHYVKNVKPAYEMPTPSKSIQKVRSDRTREIINDLEDNVGECEDEMVRMRESHQKEIEDLKIYYKDILQGKEDILEHTIKEKDEAINKLRDEIDALLIDESSNQAQDKKNIADSSENQKDVDMVGERSYQSDREISEENKEKDIINTLPCNKQGRLSVTRLGDRHGDENILDGKNKVLMKSKLQARVETQPSFAAEKERIPLSSVANYL